MAGTSISPHAYPPFDGSFAVAEHVFAEFEEELAQFVHASFAPGTERRAPDPAPTRPSRREAVSLTRIAIVVCFAAAAIWGWRAVASHAAQPATAVATATGAGAAEHQRLEKTAHDLADLRQTVARLAAGQGQLTRRMRRLGGKTPDADASAPAHRVAAHRPATAASRQAARRVAAASRASPPARPATHLQSEARLSAAGPLRPPRPVP